MRSQHEPPRPPARALAPVPTANPWDELSPADWDEELWVLAGRPEDAVAYELRATDVQADDVPPPDANDTRWSLDLDDPYSWLPEPKVTDDAAGLPPGR